MPLTNLLKSVAGTCPFCSQNADILSREHPDFCSQNADILSREHPDCRRTHQAGWTEPEHAPRLKRRHN